MSLIKVLMYNLNPGDELNTLEGVKKLDEDKVIEIENEEFAKQMVDKVNFAFVNPNDVDDEEENEDDEKESDNEKEPDDENKEDEISTKINSLSNKELVSLAKTSGVKIVKKLGKIKYSTLKKSLIALAREQKATEDAN